MVKGKHCDSTRVITLEFAIPVECYFERSFLSFSWSSVSLSTSFAGAIVRANLCNDCNNFTSNKSILILRRTKATPHPALRITTHHHRPTYSYLLKHHQFSILLTTELHPNLAQQQTLQLPASQPAALIMAPIWSFQPCKGLLTALVMTISPLYISILSIYYIPKRFRPHPSWSLHTSLGRAFYYLLFRYAAMVHMAPDYALRSGALKERFVLVKPSSSANYTGVLKHPTIKPVPFGGIWFPNAPTSKDIQTQKFVLHLPGGAYAIASPPSRTGEFPSSVFSSKINAITFYAQYRVAATPETRFPAAIQDAVTFYSYLLDLGIPAKNIIISGDSAGGNLVIALLRYIEANKGLFPSPRGAISWPPWVNITTSAVSAYKRSAKSRTDLVPWQILEWGLEAYPPPSTKSSSEVQAYVSPAQHPFSTCTPLLLQVGSAEVFHEDIQAFTQDMAGIEGNRVKYYETPHAPHDLILCGKILGMVKETEDVVELAHEFFNV